jgi:hypothetical protein
VYLRSLHLTAQKYADFQVISFGTYEEVAGVPREHDGFMGGIDALIAEFGSGFAEAYPRFPKILRQVSGERRFGGSPAVMFLAVLEEFLAVVALPASHAQL